MLTTKLIAASTVCAACVIATPAPAHAYPCAQWAFSGPTTLRQSNGWRLFFDSTSPRALGPTEAVAKGGHMRGTIEGGINGNSLTLTARWTSGPIGKYEGQIDPNGGIKGITYDTTAPHSTATWYSDQRLSCLAPA